MNDYVGNSFGDENSINPLGPEGSNGRRSFQVFKEELPTYKNICLIWSLQENGVPNSLMN